MGYTTEFEGSITIDPPLNEEEISYLLKFSGTRRMDRSNGPYFVDGTGYMGEGHDPDVRDLNKPPAGQPSLWCDWEPTRDGTEIKWNGMEKFYNADKWMLYLIRHFLGGDPLAKRACPERFQSFGGHTLNGEIYCQGEDVEDRWILVVADNVVTKELLD